LGHKKPRQKQPRTKQTHVLGTCPASARAQYYVEW
jgi:hypothetical protein